MRPGCRCRPGCQRRCSSCRGCSRSSCRGCSSCRRCSTSARCTSSGCCSSCCCRSRRCRRRSSSSSAGSDTHVIQVEERGRIEEYEMQLSIRSGHHIGKCKLRIRKRVLYRRRYQSNTTKSSPKMIVSTVVVILKPEAHVIPLAGHSRDGLIKKTVAAYRTEECCEVPRVRVPVDSTKRGISGVGPGCEATGFETSVNNKARASRRPCSSWRRCSCS